MVKKQLIAFCLCVFALNTTAHGIPEGFTQKPKLPRKLDFKRISVGSAQHIGALGSDDSIWLLQGNQWQMLPGRLQILAVGSDGEIWGASVTRVEYFDPKKKYIDQKDVAPAPTLIAYYWTLWRWDKTTWLQMPLPPGEFPIPPGGTRLTTEPFGMAKTAELPVWRLNVHVGNKNAVYVTTFDENGVHRIHRWAGRWETVPGIPGEAKPPKQISVGSNGALWGINEKNELFSFKNNVWTKQTSLTGMINIEAGDEKHVWGYTSEKTVSQLTEGKTWKKIPGKFSQISAGANGELWGIEEKTGLLLQKIK